MKTIFLIVLCFFIVPTATAQNSTGIFQQHAATGQPKLQGSVRYDANLQAYFLKGAGENKQLNKDEGSYLYRELKGDFILTASFEFTGEKFNPNRIMGWMVRESIAEDAASIKAQVQGNGLTIIQKRAMQGAAIGPAEDVLYYAKKSTFQVIQLERQGKKITMRVANWGEPLQEVGAYDMPNLPDVVLAGLFTASNQPDLVEEIKVWNVRIDRPVEDVYHPHPEIRKKISFNQPVLGGRLETIRIDDGQRKVIYESKQRFEAPNWMPDGKSLLFNENGALFTIGLDGSNKQKLNTGTINQNNNDHGIAFDKKTLAISSAQPGKGGSYVYVLPLAGGEPRLVTQQSPSYWHGWAPNNQEVTIVAQRNGEKVFNLYKVNIHTGKETALTKNTSGHVDGPEYSPDGKYIYYNANPTGTMQLWRMKPDGTAKEQLTFDEYHNWFPHISPDGKWIAYISFPTTIEPDSHPFYQRVTLRIMPTAGGAPRVIAYLYGGQGTINVNSWSPDSRSFSFVSNSEAAE
jgi:TolB protein